MLNKLTIALSAGIVLGAVSTASAAFDNYDPWVDSNQVISSWAPGHNAMARGYDARANMGYGAYAFQARPRIALDAYDPWIQHDVPVW